LLQCGMRDGALVEATAGHDALRILREIAILPVMDWISPCNPVRERLEELREAVSSVHPRLDQRADLPPHVRREHSLAGHHGGYVVGPHADRGGNLFAADNTGL
jgi:hypothetical protein